MDEVGENEWLLRSLGGEEWRLPYSSTTAAQLTPGYGIFSHYLTTHPRSPRVFVQRIGPGAQHTPMNTTLTTATPDGTRTERELAVEQVWDVLDEVFGIVPDPDRRPILEERLREYTMV